MIKLITNLSTFSLIVSISLLCGLNGIQAQCTLDTISFGSANAPVVADDTVQVAVCNWATEYFTINNAVEGDTYEFTSSISTDYLTAVEGDPNTGTVLGSGTTPLTVTATTSGTIYVHVNVNSDCDTNTECRTTTVECTSCPPGYCQVGPTDSTFTQLESVSLNGESNNIDWVEGCPGEIGVYDATSETADLIQGGSYTLDHVLVNCTGTGSWETIVKVWVDWNQDLEFDSDEAVGYWVGESTTAGTPGSITINVPSDAELGPTTMRVLAWETNVYEPDDIDDPCNLPGLFTWGAVADFTIEVLEAPDCEITCPSSPIEVDNDPGECGAFVSIDEPTIIGQCDNDPVNDFNDTGDASDFYPVGTTTVTFTVPGTAAECSFDVTVEDVEPIQLDCPSEINVPLGPGACDAVVTYEIEVVDNCDVGGIGTIEGFQGPFDPAEWTIILNGPNTAVDVSNAPDEIELTGPDGAGCPVGAAAILEIEITEDVEITFDWEFNTTDAANWDPPGYSVNGVFTAVLTAGQFGTGTVTLDLSAGDIFAFEQQSVDCAFGAGFLTITNFIAEGAGLGGPDEPDLVVGLPSGSTFDIGTTTVIYEIEDGFGGFSSCEFNVNVEEFANPTSALACNDLVNISVDATCEALINADMILEGGPYGCYDNYEIIIETMDGVQVGNPISSQWINETLMVTIVDPNTGNSCWGNILVEDKIDPVIECRDVTILCGEEFPDQPAPGGNVTETIFADDVPQTFTSGGPLTLDFDFSGLPNNFEIVEVTVPMSIDAPAGTWVSDMTIELTNEVTGTTVVLSDATCTASGFTWENIEFSSEGTEYDDPGDCAVLVSLTDELVQPIGSGAGSLDDFIGETASGTWTLEFVNTFPSSISVSLAGVNITVFAEEIDPSDNCGDVDVEFTDFVEIFNECDDVIEIVDREWVVTDGAGNTSSCVQTIEVLRTGLDELTLPDNATLNCTQNFAVDDQGNPHPSTTGEPGGQCPNVIADYTDIVINDCPGESHILRQWSLIDWCTGEVEQVTQVIKVMNNTVPEIECLDEVEVSTGFNTCEGNWEATLESLFAQGAIDALPFDECSDDVSYTVSSSAGTVSNINDTWIVSDMPVGTHEVTYTADDGCGNTAECVTLVNVVDDVAPVAVCDLDTRVSLGGGNQGFARVFVDAFDDGSWDNCGVESVLVNRDAAENTPTARACGNSGFFSEFVDFCCEDIENGSGEVTVYLQVTDISGNTNICTSTVYVEDNVAPSITCPSELQVMVNCQFDWGDFDFEDPNSDVSQAALDELFGGIVAIQRGEDRVTRVVDPAAQPANALDEVTIVDGFTIDNCPDGLEIEQQMFVGYECKVGQGVDVPFNDPILGNPLTTQPQRIGFQQDPDLAIVRGWRVTDAYGNETRDCVQEIRVINTSPFTGIDNFSGLPPSQWEIVWPGNQTLGICTDGEEGVDPDNMGRPEIQGPNLACADILISYTDEIFTGSQAGSACLKILRTWKVIDWCQPETIGDPWTHIQEIKIMNADAPIVTNCEDVTFEFPEAEGCDAEVEDFVLEVEHACIEEDLLEDALEVTYQIDAFNTGSFDISGTGFDASGTYPYGEHRIVWTVTDPCGNETVCEHLFTVADLKEPTPVCFNGIATVVMPATGAISLDADYFDAGSFDNCGEVDLYIWSDETEMTEDDPINYEEEWTWTCDDLDGAGELTFEVRILAVDQFGNSDWCETYVLIQDNMNVCPDTASGTALISGLITNEEGQGVEQVDVDLNSQNGGFGLSYHTGSDGSFNFTGVPMSQEYDLRGTRTDNPLNGVTTYDIALIQRHILGTRYLDNPYKLIAADVNNDGQINVVDIAQLRRLILGTYDEFPNNDSWKVIVDEDLEMGVTVPDHRTVMDLGMVNRDLHNNNFIGVKIGDVNASHNASGVMSSSERSLAEALELRVNDEQLRAGEQVVVAVSADNAEGLFGYQGTINFDHNSLEFVGYESGAIELSDANFGFHLLSEGMITTSWSDTEALTEGSELFSLVFEVKSDGQLSEKLDFSSNRTVAEAYNDRGVMGVEMVFEGSAMEVNNFSLYQNTPNPFGDVTQIGFVLPEATEATLTIYDVTGKVVHVIEGDYSQGYNEESVNRDQLGSAGVYYYQLETGDHTATKKMIFMD